MKIKAKKAKENRNNLISDNCELRTCPKSLRGG